MPARSKSQITTNDVTGRRLPRNRPPTHPGEMLFEEFIKPLDLTQVESIQISIGPDIPEGEYNDAHGVAIGRIIIQ